MKVIFLDFDGVLNNFKYLLSLERTNKDKINYYSSQLDINKVLLVKDICQKTNAKIIITSSWRRIDVFKEIKEFLINQGLPVIGHTPFAKGNRADEIKEYLKNHKEIENFIILDDEYFTGFESFEDNLIQTDFENGLTEEKTLLSIKKLRR